MSKRRDEIFPVSVKDGISYRSFIVDSGVTAGIAWGAPVALNTDGELVLGINEQCIGHLVFDEAYVAKTENLDSDVLKPLARGLVALKGVPRFETANDAISVGTFVKRAADGEVAPEATPTTKTVLTSGIALTAAAADGDVIEVLQ